MRIFKTVDAILLEHEDHCYVSRETDWDGYINRDDLYEQLMQEISRQKPVGPARWLTAQRLLAPIGSQEVWAAGVTYLRSKTARMEESKESGGSVFYDKVYEAERPELESFQQTVTSNVPVPHGVEDITDYRKEGY